jgi:hypothetical protein
MGARTHTRRGKWILHRNACSFRYGIRFDPPRNIRVVAGIRVWVLQRQLNKHQFMRKTTKQPLALAAVNKAWDAFYDATKVESEKELAKQGWKTIRTIAEEAKLTIAAITCRVETAVGKGMLETKKATIQTNQGVREVKFFRPI